MNERPRTDPGTGRPFPDEIGGFALPKNFNSGRQDTWPPGLTRQVVTEWVLGAAKPSDNRDLIDDLLKKPEHDLPRTRKGELASVGYPPRDWQWSPREVRKELSIDDAATMALDAFASDPELREAVLHIIAEAVSRPTMSADGVLEQKLRDAFDWEIDLLRGMLHVISRALTTGQRGIRGLSGDGSESSGWAQPDATAHQTPQPR